MPNLALEIDLPSVYIDQATIATDIHKSIATIDYDAAVDTQRAINAAIRLKPGGDVGLKAVDPTTGIQVSAGYDSEAPADGNLFDYIARPNEMDVEPREVTSAMILQQEAPVYESFVKGYEPARRSVQALVRVDLERIVSLYVWGRVEEFDRQYAVTIFETLRSTIGPPLGEPYFPVEDADLQRTLGRIADSYVSFAGDRKMMEFYGEFDRGPFQLALDRLLELRANPDRFRAGVVGIYGGASVWAIRIEGDLTPNWSPLVDAFMALGMEEREDLGNDVFAAASGEGDQRTYVAAMPRGELFFQLAAPSDEALRALIAAVDAI